VRIRIVNRQSKVKVDTKQVREWVRRLAEHVPESQGWGELCVMLVDDEESGEIHGRAFGDTSPTDVMTLSYRDEECSMFDVGRSMFDVRPKESQTPSRMMNDGEHRTSNIERPTSNTLPPLTAEIIVNVVRAQEEGKKRSRRGKWSAKHELALYIAHGIDHLTGADDAIPAERKKMRRREMRWVRGLDNRLDLNRPQPTSIDID